MEGSALQVFSFSETNQVRVYVDMTGAPWWVAKDVCDILEIANSRQATSRLDDDEKGVVSPEPTTGRGVSSTDTPTGGRQEMTAVNESGLYTLILRSDKPVAKEFRRWVTHDVLPKLRATGAYSLPKAKPIKATLPALLRSVAMGVLTHDEARAQLGLSPKSQSPQSGGQRTLFAEPKASQSPHRRGTTLRAKLAAWHEANPDVFQVDASELMVELGNAPDAETALGMYKVRASVSTELRKLGVESQSPHQRGGRGFAQELDSAIASIPASTGLTSEEVLKMLGLPNVRSNQSKVGAALQRAGWRKTRPRVGGVRRYVYSSLSLSQSPQS